MGRREREAKRAGGTGATGKTPTEATPQANAQLIALQRLAQAGPRRVGRYSSQHEILLVGEGDFTFALAVASAVGGERLVCTSLDKGTQLQVKYDNKVKGVLGALQGLGAAIHHDVDATALQEYEFMRIGPDKALRRFQRIVFNFPCVGLLDEQQLQARQELQNKKMEQRLRKAGKGRNKQEDEDKKNRLANSKSTRLEELNKGRAEAAQRRHLAGKKLAADLDLLASFLASAKLHLADRDSQIHVALRRVTIDSTGSEPIERAGRKQGLVCTEFCDFHPGLYTGYVPQQTHPKGKGLQPLTPAVLFVFRLADEGDDPLSPSEDEEGEAANQAPVDHESDEDGDGRGVYSDDGSEGEGGVDHVSENSDEESNDVGRSERPGSAGGEVEPEHKRKREADSARDGVSVNKKKKRKKNKGKQAAAAAAAAAKAAAAAVIESRVASGKKKTTRGKKRKNSETRGPTAKAQAAISFLLGR